MNFIMIFDFDVYWEGICIFYDYVSCMIFVGFYVYFEFGELILCVLLFVVINKFQKEFDFFIKFFFDEFKVVDVFFEYVFSEYLIFFDLYMIMFEDEELKYFLIGGWIFIYEDVEESNDEIVVVLRKVVNFCEDLMGQGFFVGYFFDVGYIVFKFDSFIYLVFCCFVNFIIIIFFVFEGVFFEEKVDLENFFINIIDELFCQFGKNGCVYVNEVDLYQDNW